MNKATTILSYLGGLNINKVITGVAPGGRMVYHAIFFIFDDRFSFERKKLKA